MATALAELNPEERPPSGEAPAFCPRGRIIAAEDVEICETANSYLEAAKREARRLRVEANEAFEDERRRGFEEGRKEGAAAAARLLAETTARADRHLADADVQLVDLAMAVVRRILGEMDIRQQTLRAVHHALTKQRKDQPLVIYASPELVDQLRIQIGETVDEEAGHLITVEADPRLEVGECRLASNVGFVELGIEAQLHAVHQGLLDGLKHSARG